MKHGSEDLFEELTVSQGGYLPLYFPKVESEGVVVVEVAKRFKSGQMQKHHPNRKYISLWREIWLKIILKILSDEFFTCNSSGAKKTSF